MALHQLLSMIPHEIAHARRAVVARWTDTPETGEWDEEPSYGAFVDDQGLVVSGSKPARAFLESDDPRRLELAPEVERALGEARVWFVDWGSQNVPWPEIFDLWEAWEARGLVVDCGSVSVSWGLVGQWTAPGWVAFRGGFDGAPLTFIPRQTGAPAPDVGVLSSGDASFLARAVELKTEPLPSVPSQGVLPMLPFTIESLKDPRHLWPVGVP